MAEYTFTIYAPDNFSELPAEDGTQRSSLTLGETITYLGGGEAAEIIINDPTDGLFSEIQTDQTLVNPITFDGVSYSAGQATTPSYVLGFSGSDGESYTLVSFQFSLNTANEQPDAAYFLGPPPPDGTVLTLVSEENAVDGTTPAYPQPCYGPGTLIDTPDGPRPVEALVAGDLVSTLDHGAQAIRWIRSGHQPLEGVDEEAKPVLIGAGALGPGLPGRDLNVSPQHRILAGGGGQLVGCFQAEAFAPAKSLTSLAGIRHMNGKAQIRWIHFACEQHEVVVANGCLSESLLLGPMVTNGLTAVERRSLSGIFGGSVSGAAAMNGPPARDCLTVGEVQRQLGRAWRDKPKRAAQEIRKWDIDLAMERYESDRLRRAG